MVTINQSIEQQPPDPSARLTLSVENLTFIRLLQKSKGSKSEQKKAKEKMVPGCGWQKYPDKTSKAVLIKCLPDKTSTPVLKKCLHDKTSKAGRS